MITQTRYKNHNIVVDGRNYDILQGKHILAAGYVNDTEDPVARAKQTIDADFVSMILLEIRKLPATKR